MTLPESAGTATGGETAGIETMNALGLTAALLTGSAFLHMPPPEQQAYVRAATDAMLLYEPGVARCVGPLLQGSALVDLARTSPDKPMAELIHRTLHDGCSTPLLEKRRVVGPLQDRH